METQDLLFPQIIDQHSIRVSEAVSADLDERVEVSHSFVIRVLEIGLPSGTNRGARSSDFIQKLLMNLWILGEFEECKSRCVGGGFSDEINRLGNIKRAGLVTAYVRQEPRFCGYG